jgi:hypothetical protein
LIGPRAGPIMTKKRAGMSAVTIQQMVERISALMEERLAVRGATLGDKLRKGGRLLPRKVRQAAGRLAVAGVNAQNPRLLLQIDEGVVSKDYDICVRHLTAINAGAGLRRIMGSMVTSIAFGLLVLGVAVIAVLKWRGFV